VFDPRCDRPHAVTTHEEQWMLGVLMRGGWSAMYSPAQGASGMAWQV